jgi:uncharacterized protein YjbJ (UPF0337 family)
MDADLRQLEREAEAARAKLAADLAVLRSPSTYSEFGDGLKQEAMGAKNAVVDSVKSTAENWIDEIKAKAAANPGAALLIGAGVAWRLLQNPPIATALVGAGLFSLLRTSPQPGHRYMSDDAYLEEAKHRLKEQASDLAISAREQAAGLALGAKERAAELAGSAKEGALGFVDSARAQMHDARDAATAQAASLVDGAKDRATELTDDARAQATDWQDFAKSKTQQWRDAATAATQELRDDVSTQVTGAALRTAGAIDDATDAVKSARERATRQIGAATDYSVEAAGNGYAAVQRTAREAFDEQHRDKLLLGAAGIAVTAALTLALQRRINGAA